VVIRFSLKSSMVRRIAEHHPDLRMRSGGGVAFRSGAQTLQMLREVKMPM
jgi:hypothetical protein